ncbi:MAG TPA: OsmC family protein [Anaerolineae bacterium]|nr:OsmC family protein [Anaerolineae bacterium]
MSNTKSAQLTWSGDGLNFHGLMGSGYELDFSGQSGPDTGTSPMEMLLASAAACSAMDIVHVLRKKREDLTGFSININGQRADSHPQVFTAAHITFTFRGRNLNPKAVERAIQLSQETYCSVSITLQRAGTDITTSYEIEEETD